MSRSAVQTKLSFVGTAAQVREDTDTLAPGAKAGPWVIEAQIGRGGMGTIYAVTHEEIGKRAALKVMHRWLVSDIAAERILTEARVVNRVGHANIVDIFETGTLEDGQLYIVMERLDGRPLNAVAEDGKLRSDRVIAILLQICDALIAAHAAGVVHRDLKLDNVFVIDNPDDPANPKVKVLDWGIAKEITTDVHHTVDGQLVGTPQYLSPEQARGLEVGPPSDVYSLGVMAYELFLEQLPFEADTAAEVMTMHLRAPPPEPIELWPDIPHLLEKLLLQMLAKHPDKRPSMLTVAHTLETVRSELDERRRAQSEGPPALLSVMLPRTARARTSAPALAATQLASRRVGRTWGLAIGAVALVTSATMFGVMRDGNAKTPPAAALALPHTMRAPAIVDPLPPALPTMARDHDSVPPPPAPLLPAKPAPRRVAPKPTFHAPPHGSSHIPGKLDPDGTVDPYS